jgi:uncharacterized protein DUF6931
MATRLPGVTARTAAEIAPHVADLTPEGKAVLRPQHTPGDYLDALAAAGHLRDAVRFLAHCLGRREAVWWACVCCRLAPDAAPAPAVVAAFGSAEAWCYRPTEENRRAAYAAAEAAQLEHPAALAALGAFFSGGSVAPANVQQPVPPGPFHTARCVAGSVLLSAVRTEPQTADARLRLFLSKGVEVANTAATQARGAG